MCVCVCGYYTHFKPEFLLAAELKMRYVFRELGLTQGVSGALDQDVELEASKHRLFYNDLKKKFLQVICARGTY